MTRFYEIALTIIVAAIGAVTVTAILAAFSGCATGVRVWSHPLYDNSHQPLEWFADGPNMVLTVENPTDHDIIAVVECLGAPAQWIVPVKAHGFRSALGQLLNRDTAGDACRLVEVK